MALDDSADFGHSGWRTFIEMDLLSRSVHELLFRFLTLWRAKSYAISISTRLRLCTA